MSSSDDNMSESSNLDSSSVHNEGQYSPFFHGSPSHLVPQLAIPDGLTELTCGDAIRDNKPYLRIVEQPMDYFRFRYKSEMMGTHGCLLGKNSSSGKSKSHPTVELCNYNGRAMIRCSLSQHNNPLEHPHKLTEDDQDKDVTSILPLHDSYKVAFNGMGIIHTAKKDIPNLLFNKYSQEMGRNEFNDNKLRVRCENETKKINLNIVRLKFTAHDVNTGELICPPVFSEPIHNMKSAATNDLKICRASRYYGRPSGRDEVFILVEKVNKKNIAVRFFETDENNVKIWKDEADFIDTDVHHQYAIVFKTPPYHDQKITSDVKVWFELYRKSDGRTSAPKEFIYKADVFSRELKKRKAGSTFSSLGSSGGSIKSFSDLPITLDFVNETKLPINELKIEDNPTLPVSTYNAPTPPSSCDALGDALLFSVSRQTEAPSYTSPMLGQPNVPPPPVIQLDSTEMNRLLGQNHYIPSEERRQFLESDWSEYFQSFDEHPSSELNMMSFVKNSLLVADSDRLQYQGDTPKLVENEAVKKESTTSDTHDSIRSKSEYCAVYSADDGKAVKTLVKELCEIIRNKVSGKRQIIQDKLKRLFDMRLSNGDTFLHMTLCSNQPSLQVIVKLIHDVDMSSLLNIQNHRMRTILHLAVIKDQPALIPFLISKGCNPMLEDDEGNNVLHYAVIWQTCLEPALSAARAEKMDCNVDACNYEKQTPLHLSAMYGSEKSARLLLDFSASCLVRDSEGRTPLHIAAAGDSLAVVSLLVERMAPSDIDAADGRGLTALQLVCAGPRPHSLTIARMLLDKKADPLKSEESGRAAWELARDQRPLLQLLKEFAEFPDDQVKSEPEDDYESADDMENSSELADLPLYIAEVSATLDRSKGYRELAKRLHRDSLLKVFEGTPSPTSALLNHIKELNDDVTSKSLALLLEDIGEREAATIIKKRILEL